MKLEKWALLAEIVSAVCIVLSLVFVGVQVQISGRDINEGFVDDINSELRNREVEF